MAYRLKTIRYMTRDVRIVLQNENGPCPLLAAANCLLLKGSITLPAHAIRNNVASLEDITNMLANHAMSSQQQHSHHTPQPPKPQLQPQQQTETAENSNDTASGETTTFFVNELMEYLPKFQHGMDVNPCFTRGIQGYEYTAELTAFDMLGCPLVHGWLVSPHHQSEVAAAIGRKSYNQLVDFLVAHSDDVDHGATATEARLAELQRKIAEHSVMTASTPAVDLLDDNSMDNSNLQQQQQQQLAEWHAEQHDLQHAATVAELLQHFLSDTSHQLTPYGLEQLQETLGEEQLCVFFRNNHYATMTKHKSQLFLLVTDLGYASTPSVVWERLDVVDGDTEYCNSNFGANAEPPTQSGTTLTPEQLMAASSQTDADYHLALHLSTAQQQGTSGVGGGTGNAATLTEQEGTMLAAATEASVREYHGLPPTQPQMVADGTGNARVEVGIPVSLSSPGKKSSSLGSPYQQPDHDQEHADRMLALQLQGDDAAAAPAPQPSEAASLRLAQQLQQQEDLAAGARQRQATAGSSSPSSNEKCSVM